MKMERHLNYMKSLRFRISMILSLLMTYASFSFGQGLTVTMDPLSTSACCTFSQPCSCSAGINISGGLAPYQILVFDPSNIIIGSTQVVTGICPGVYTFQVRDANNVTVTVSVPVGINCCKLTCKDTVICYNLADSLVRPPKPRYSGQTAGSGTGGGAGGPDPTCTYDSIWNNAPNVFPVGTTVVTWYVIKNGFIDSCSQNIVRNPPSSYNISFTTSPPIVAGVINICNGQSITFNDNSTGITGLLWNFGNGYYSTNSTHTEPAWHYPPGTYYDTLTVFDACGVAHDTAFTVVVDSASGPDIFCVSVVCPGDTVTYHTSAVCTGYTWAVSGGSFLFPPSSTSDSCVVVWGPGPSGTITLNVSGCTPPLTCPVGTTKTIHIVPATMPIAGDTIVCAGTKSCYAVECIPGNTHSWEVFPANAGTVTGQGTCEICIEWAPGFFGPVTIQLNYQNVLTGAGCNLPGECKDMHGCGGTASITVDVRPNFGISGPAKVCPNTVSAPFNGMNLTNNTIAPGVSWKLVTPVPSVLTFANTALLNAYTWNAGPGVYELTAYAPANTYCTDSAKVNVTVVDMLIPGPITGPDTVCVNTPAVFAVAPNMTGVSYLWTITNGTITGPLNGSSVNASFNAPGGTLTVVQYLSASPSCTSQVSLTKNVATWPVFPLPVVTASSPIVCMNSTVTYSIPTPLLSNATYTWSIVPATAGNILSANGGDSIVIKWVSAAITPIFVKLKITRCYADSVMVPINLLPLPTVPNISYFPANPCVNTTVNFSTLNPGPLWNWSFGDAGTSSLQNPSHIYTAAGNYNVQLYVTNASGCSDTATTAITVEDVPVVPVINGPDSVCINSLASYNFSQPLFPGAYYSWSLSGSPKGIISGSGNNFMNLKWTIAGTDTVKVRVQANCLDTTIKYVVVISPLPTPGISVVSPACQNSNVSFTGSGGVSYNWAFTGGSPGFSSLSNPIVTWGIPGSYNVSLSVTNAAGCSANANTTMVINPEPNALINGPATICSFPGSVTMSAVAQPGYTFLWTPTGSTSPSITTTISSLTTFSCVVTNAFGCTKLSNSITVDTLSCTTIIDSCNVNDSIDFTYTPPICLTQTYTKIYSGTLTGWSFGPGGSAGAVSPVSATFPFPGNFPVTVNGVVIGTYPDGSVCTKNISRTRIVTIPFDPDFDFKYQCNGSNVMQVLFTNTSKYLGSAAAYNWTWYDATYATTLSTNPFPPAITLAAGTHVINLSVFDPVTGASCTITKTINVPVPIVASFTVSSPLCVGAPNAFTNTSVLLANQLSMLFNNGNGGTATSSPASIPYANSGNFTAILSVTDIYGCSSSASQPVNVLPAGSGSITVGALACDSVSLTASGPGPFTWNVISPPPFPNNPAYVKTSGYYSVTGIGVNGCPYTAGPVLVTVNKSPQVTITGATQYCQGEALNIKTSAAGINYAWIRLPSTPVGTNSPNLNIIANTPGTFTYQVTVTAANGCTGSAMYTITVDPVPGSASIVASGPLTFCQGDSVKLTVSPPGFSYLWSKSPAPPLTSPANAQTSYWATQSGTYSVIVTTANGCAYPAITPVVVTVNPVPPASITGDTTVCEGETLTLNTTPVGGATYSWTGPGASGNTNPFVKPNMQLTNSGYYVVTVTNTYGCTAVDSVDVTVFPGPVVPIINSIPGGVLCEGQLFNLFVTNPTGGQTYGWSTGQLGLSINAVLPGDYSVTTSNVFGCTAQSNILTIHPKPDLSCVPTGCYEFCIECDSVSIPGPAGLFSYQWEIFNGINFVYYSSNQNLTVLPPGGKFRLIGATQWGCADSTDTLSIDFLNCCPAPDTTTCADACVNFDNNNLSGWQPYPAAPNVGLTMSNAGSQNGPSDYYILASDLAGPSFLEGSFNLLGKWCCGEFCFDYKLFDDAVAGTPNVNPQFTIFNGTLGFRFTAAASVNETSPWQRFCAPITDCNPPPVSPSGTWTPIAGTAITDWTTVLSNVTNVVFKVDYTAGIGETSGFDNVCIQSGMPSVSAGNDTTVCAGSVITLHADSCNGTATWYQISGDTLVYVGNGPIVDVTPQQNTCYVLICCSAGACCCDTDTVCVNVNPLPILKWTTVYPSVCQNSAPVFLDSSNVMVWVNNNWVPVSQLSGTGYFSGPFVTGNYFNPTTIGTYTICYTWTDSVGCTNTACNTISVQFCCDTTFQINAGADTTICAGGVVTLTVTGCSGAPQWFKMTVAGPVPVGQGPIFDANPSTSTCYMVVCCDPLHPTCCDTDTVCVNVLPHPTLSWPTVYPNLCNNGGPITLNPADILVTINNVTIPVTQAGGTGSFSGTGVSGNIFTPPGIGIWTICYTWTDSSGCSATVCNTISVEFCCDTTFQINAGADTSICQGQFVVLNVTGCTGTPTWYALGVEGPIQVGTGEVLDVFPQQSTCYMVVCCNPLYPTCCDTDTVCVTVYPHPILSWPSVYNDICDNGGPLTLNPNDIFVDINNTWVMSGFTGGTGYFSGPGVFGNTFTPPGTGSYVITFTYTSPNGCVATITNSITVVHCCDTTFQINAGNDTTICAGNFVPLHVSGCSGTPTWYALGIEGPVQVGTGEVLDVFPQQSTCYIVVCCNPQYPSCCDTDTVCVNVMQAPLLQWPVNYPNICYGQGSMTLNPDDILVWVNNTWVPSSQAGGTGYFSGQGVFGNIFNPPAGNVSYLISFTYTFGNGCSTTVYTGITVLNCCGTMNVSAGPDQTICDGQSAVLTASGCNGTPNWYALTNNGPVFAGSGVDLTVHPGQSTCYMVICCLPENPVCCDTDTVCINVLPNIVVGPMTGTHFSACLPAVFSGSIYSVPAVSTSGVYLWTVPNGMSITSGQGTNTITTQWTNLAIGTGIVGVICVDVWTPCGWKTICHQIDLNVAAPVMPNSISGPGKLCPGDTAIYSVAAVARASSYSWTVPAGMTIISGAGTNIITVVANASYIGGTVSVIAANACGNSAARTKATSLNLPVRPGVISGPVTGLCGTNGAVYTISAVPGANSYFWTVTNGTIIGSNTGLSITVNWNSSFSTGTVSVYSINGCGTSSVRSFTVSGIPAQPGPVTGPVNVCVGATYHYSIATVAGAANYNWTTPGTLVAGQGTKDIDVTYNTGTGTNQVISVRAINSCGMSAVRNLPGVTISSCTREGLSDDGSLAVQPNPAHAETKILLNMQAAEEGVLEVIDTEGRIVWSKAVAGNGALQEITFPANEYARGLYLIRMNTRDTIRQIRLVIN